MLARVEDVPGDVLYALDDIVNAEETGFFCLSRKDSKRAAPAYAVVRYLHSITELERLLPNKKNLPE